MTPGVSLTAWGGPLAIAVFTVTLFSFVAESELTEYVQTTLNYRQPFFLFYVVHSSFIISLPCHLLYLAFTSSHSTSAFLKGLRLATTQHLTPIDASRTTISVQFPVFKSLRLILALTAGITIPALLWFAAITLASVSDVTAIWNTNAFFAYVLSVKVFGLKWESRKLGAVMLATLGVLAVVYGGSSASVTSEDSASTKSFIPPSAPLMGDVLTAIASVGYAGYQVFYKKYAALASDPERASDTQYEALPSSGDAESLEADRSLLHTADLIYPPPFGLHSNLLTSAIGACTLTLLWIPLPLLHYLDIERFALPADAKTTAVIAAIALSGSLFNAGFMVLLGMWGPIITSVGGLLTIVLVFLSDVLTGATETLTVWSVVGSATIVVAFGILAYDMLR